MTLTRGQAALLQHLIAGQKVHEYDAWFYTPMAQAFTRDLQPKVVVYDCMDELKSFLHAPPQLAAYESELLSRADLVFAGGRSLYESKRSSHPHVHAFPSSIDAKTFLRQRFLPACMNLPTKPCLPSHHAPVSTA